MERSVYAYVWRHSRRTQIALLVATLATFPILYFSLDLPKTIVNDAIGSFSGRPIEIPLIGLEIEFSQIGYLLVLSLLFLLTVVINGAIKYYLNVAQGLLGERLLRRLRYELYGRVLRFPIPHFRKVSSGEIIPMITSEVEQIGGFMGSAYVTPIFQGGYLLTLLGFMMIQDWMLGTLAIMFYPIQAWLIPKLQYKVNMLAKQRVRTVRKLADRIGETIAGVGEVHANDTSALERTDVSDRLGTIFDIRYRIFKLKYFIKFLNNFIGQLTPFFFYAVGGYLVIQGDLSFGALVAVLAAYKDLSGPWKELLDFYQLQADSSIKYTQVIEQFDPPGLMPQQMQDEEPEIRLSGPIAMNNLGLVDDDGSRRLESITVELPMDRHIAIVGDGASGKEELAQVIARLILPTSGSLHYGGVAASGLPESVTGRQIGYVGPGAYLFSASVAANLTYALRHRPNDPARLPDDEARVQWLEEAVRSGNSPYDLQADWIDRAAADAKDDEALVQRMLDALTRVGLDHDIYQFGLRGHIDPASQTEIAEDMMAARAAISAKLDDDPDAAKLIERFDQDRYNSNATVAENLLFGNPVGDSFDLDRLAENDYVAWVLREAKLADAFLRTGAQVAETMVELFADLPPGHEFFDLFSFISSDDLPEFQAILGRVSRGSLEALPEADRLRLISLPFKLITARHRLGLVEEEMQQQVVVARRIFRDNLPERLQGRVEFYDPERFASAATIQDNILFGKVAYDQPDAVRRVAALIGEVLGARGLRSSVMEVGLAQQVGVAGSRLSGVQRQKLAVARALVKRPDLLVLNQATSGLDGASQSRLLEAILEDRAGRGLIWVLSRPQQAQFFDRVLVMAGGRLVEHGDYEDLNVDGKILRDLIDSD
ncbi:MAG: ABC transporter transmembrane domain-containing protein [Alphaproteobacteria bacterium]